MFAFHETTRKRVCRTAFFALCVAPTVATAAWVVDRRLPGRAAEQGARLGAQLHVRAEIANFREPRPHTFRCDGLTLADQATGRLLVELVGARVHGRGGNLVIFADSATVDVSQVTALAAKGSEWLTDQWGRVVDVRIRRVAIRLRGAELDLGELQARVESNDGAAIRVRAALRRRDAAPETKPDVQLAIERVNRAPSNATKMTLEAARPLPAAAIAGVPGFDGLDAAATFAGTVHWTSEAAGVSGVAAGRLEHVDLRSLLPAGSPHVAAGKAAVTIAGLTWRDSRLERLEGALTAEKVEVSPSLLAAAVKHLYCVQSSDGVYATGSKSLVDVDRLACRFVLDRKGLTLTGDMPAGDRLPSGCLASSGGVSLLMQPQYVDVPAGAWVQFVAGPANSWLPASTSAVKLAEQLPLP